MQFNFWPLNKALPGDALINTGLFCVKLCFSYLCTVRNYRQLEGEYSAARIFSSPISYAVNVNTQNKKRYFIK